MIRPKLSDVFEKSVYWDYVYDYQNFRKPLKVVEETKEEALALIEKGWLKVVSNDPTMVVPVEENPLRINIYTKEGLVWVETENLFNPDGCTNISSDFPVDYQAKGIKKLVEDIVKLTKESQERLVVEVIKL